MPDRSISITDVRLYPGSWRDVRAGLLGYVQFVIDGVIRVDGVTLRRTADGKPALSFPEKSYGPGAEFFYVRPVGDRARGEVERQVFAALGVKDTVA